MYLLRREESQHMAKLKFERKTLFRFFVGMQLLETIFGHRNFMI